MNDSIMTLMTSGINNTWTLVGAALVFFMQAGFAMCETGFTRAKNAGNIIMKNTMDFAIGTVLYWFIGFGIMFGVHSSIFGGIDLFTHGDYTAILPDGVSFFSYFIFETVFCATAATIVSGSMAGRTKFSAYCIYSAIVSLVIYPIEGHWIWGGGWLANIGFHDFAGSTAVHMVGGTIALVGAAILGPRIGKYDKNGKSRAIPGHNIPLAALGVFILWFAWFGFNGASTVSMIGDNAPLAGKIFFNTNLAAAAATVTVMILTWILYKKPDVSMTLNGALAGLVAITAGCDAVDPWAAAVIGVISGLAVTFSVEFIDKKLHVDDPVGAVSVHMVNGFLGTILTGLFATDDYLAANNMTQMKFFGIQCLGAVVVMAWAAACAFVTFEIINHTIGLRVTREEELSGLDLPEHGLVSAYADFMPSITGSVSVPVNEEHLTEEEAEVEARAAVPVDDAIPVQIRTEPTPNTGIASDVKLTKLSILIRQDKLDDFKNAMMDIGITGMTVSNVMGCGIQKGHTSFYRGVEQDVYLLPRIEVELVVAKVPVHTVIDTAKKVLYTGHYGDGKIFVYNVENVIKVRTGEEGYAALQDVEQY